MTSLFGGGSKPAAQNQTRALGIDLQGAQYGPPIPVVFGQNKVAGNVIWYGDFKATSHTQKQPGKGGGGGSSSTTYTYSSSFMLGLLEGPASIVTVYEGSSTTSLAARGGTSFSGAEGQAAWAHLTGTAALGYSGTAMAAFQNLELGSSASLPNFNFEVAARDQFGGGVVDANPADIVTAVCSDAQIGVGFTALGDFTAFHNYCTAAGIFFSPVYNSQNPAQQTLDDLFKYANVAPFFSEGVLKVVPYADSTITGNGVTYTPDLTAVADLGRDDFITNGSGDPITLDRTSPADAMNLVRVEFKDRANTYHTNAVSASIDQDVVSTGSRADQSESVDMITQASVARLVAQNLLQRTYYIRNTYQFQLSWRFCYLEPMDIVTLTDANTGLYLTPVRITEIGEDEFGLLSVTAEEFPEGVSHGGTYATQANGGATVDPNADPGPIDAPYLFRGPGFLVSNAQPEIWCALTGNDPLWAGCDVYISHDGTSYSYLATSSKSAAYGHLTNALPSSADPDTTGAPNVVLNGASQLLGGSMADADQFITLAMIDNELVAYQTATLAGGPSYTLGYLRRGGYGSAIAAHAINAPFVRLDDNILRIPVDPSQIGQTVYLKFVSFNVFGRGDRTLADETAYTYVIGTNVELPDVPVTPASFTATGVADGVSLKWINPNPAAVGSTLIEYATASGGPWTVLAQVGATTTAYVHHFTNGATYYYRARARGAVVSAGFSAYTGVISNTGTNVATISTNSMAAVGQVAQLPVINGGFDIAPTGYGWTADSGTWFTDTTSISPGVQPNCARHNGSSGVPTDVYRNSGRSPVSAGQVVKSQALIKAVGANGSCFVRISWRRADLSEISVTIGNVVTGTTTAGSFVVGVAPAGAVFAVTEVACDSNTAGYYLADNVVCTQYPSNQSEVPNGGGHNSVTAIDGNGLALIDFTQAGHASKNMDNIGDGVTYGRPFGSRLNAGRPFIDFSEGIHSNKNLDYIANTATAVKSSQSSAVGSQLSIDNSTFQLPLDASGNIQGWSAYAAGSHIQYQTSGPAPDLGSQYMSVYAGTISGGAQYNVTFHPQPGDRITLAATFNAISGISSSVLIAFYNSAGTYLGQVAVTTTSTTWVATHASGLVPAGTAYAKVLATVSGIGFMLLNRIAITVNDVRVSGSGSVLGNQLNAPNSLTLNYGAARTATAVTATSTGAVSINAFSVNMGGVTVSYNAVSNAVTGLTVGSTYQIYCHDSGGTGGTKTWYAYLGDATGLLTQGDDVVLAGQVTIPSSGSSGGGGTGGCPDVDAWVLRADPEGARPDWVVRAGTARPGQYLRLTDGRIGLVTHSQRKAADRVRFVDENGQALTCSRTAPIELFDRAGECVLAPECAGQKIKARADGVPFGTLVWKVEDAGPGYVQHITCQNACFWAGDEPDYLFGHHNLKP